MRTTGSTLIELLVVSAILGAIPVPDCVHDATAQNVGISPNQAGPTEDLDQIRTRTVWWIKRLMH